MTLRASKPSFNVREKLTELAVKFGLKGSELAKAETVQDARDLVSAGRKNKIINGAMMIDQRHSGSSHTNSNGYHTDRFRSQVYALDQLVQTYQQVADGPPGFTNSLKITTTTPETSVDSNEYLSVYNKMEGYDLQDLAYGSDYAKPVTISFYVKSSITGTFGFGIYRQEAAGDRQVNFTYTIDNPNVWERKSITIAGDTTRTISLTSTSGPWWNCWHLMSGTNYEGNLSPTWEAYSSTNWVGYEITDAVCTTNGATWQITGVQLEVGKNATEFEHRHYAEELKLCERYYEYSSAGTGRFYTIRNDGISRGTVTWRTVKRATPNSVTLTHSNPSGWSSATVLGKDRYGMDFGSSGNYSNFASYACDAEL